MRYKVILFATLLLMLFPSDVGWSNKVASCTIDKIVETPAYVDFWKKQKYHGWNTISYQKDDGKWYFKRNNVECRFRRKND